MKNLVKENEGIKIIQNKWKSSFIAKMPKRPSISRRNIH